MAEEKKAEPASQPDDRQKVRRVLVALDASPASVVAAEAAAELAARHRAELVGLFVEDAAYLAMETHPFSRPLHLGRSDSDAVPGLPATLRALETRSRRALLAAARRFGLDCDFRVMRGEVTATILEAAVGCDLLVLGRVGWSHRSGRNLGTTAAAALARSRGQLLPFGGKRSPVLLLLF